MELKKIKDSKKLVQVEKYIRNKKEEIKKEEETWLDFLCYLYPSSSAMLRELMDHFPSVSLNCLDLKMMLGEDNGNAIVNILGRL